MPDLGGGTDDPSGFGFAKSFPLRAGVLLIAETALISFLSAASLLWVTVSRAIILRRRARLSHDEDPPMQPVSILFLFAIFMDSIQALGSILDIRWAFLGQVVEGRYCTTQAALKQLGNDGTAWFTIAIALMTFVQVVYPTLLTPKRARQVTYAAIGFIYLFLFLIIAIPSITIDHYYGNTGLWCWIAGSNTESLRLRVGSEYAYFWLAALVSMACYGWIVYRWLQEAGQQGDELLVRDAIAMGWYPAAYLVEIFPISLVRFLTFNSKTTVGHGWTIFASVCFASSGMFNLLLWLLTGRQFGFTLPPGDDYEDEDDEVAFGRGEPLQTDTTGTTGRWTGDTASYAVRRRGTNRSGSVSAYDTDAEVILVPIPKNSDAPNGDSIHAGLENGHEMAILNARSASLATQPRLNPQSSQTQLRQPHSSLPPSLHAAQRGMQPDLLPLPVSATPIGMAAGVVPGSDVDAFSTHSGNSRGYYAPPSPPQRPPRALQVSANGLPPSARAGSEDAPLPSRTSRNVRVLSPGAAAAARAMDVRTYRSMESIATGSGSGNISPTSGHSRRHSDERGSARGSRGSGSHARRSSEDAVMALTPSTGDTRDVPTSIPTLNVWPESPQVMEYPGDPNDPHSDAGFMRSLQYPLDNIILDPLPTHSHRRQHHHSSRRHPKSGSGAGLDPNTQLPNGVSSDSASDSLSAAAPSSVLYPASSQNVRSTDGSTRRHSIRRVPVPPLPNTTTSSAEGEIPPEPS